MTKIEEILAEHAGIRLDIGCGASKQPNFVGMDMQDLPGVDIVHDVEDYPWPLPDECVIAAIAIHLLEHIPPQHRGMLKFMDEVWRVLKPGAQFAITVPHGASPGYLQDPTHCHPMNENTWFYFDPVSPGIGDAFYRFYRPKPWKIEHRSYYRFGNMDVILRKRRDDRSYHE